MTDLEQQMPQLEVDAWERRQKRIKQHYISQGMTEEEADDKATDDVRREIRQEVNDLHLVHRPSASTLVGRPLRTLHVAVMVRMVCARNVARCVGRRGNK